MKSKNRFTLLVLFLILFSALIFESMFGILCAQSLKKNEFYPGDALQITFLDVYKKPEKSSFNISGVYQIDSRGFIMMPIIGTLKVIGYNRYTLADKIKEEYKAFYEEPFLVITPLIRMTVMGPFSRPGSYLISRESSLWELLDRAGGPRENCNLKTLRVIRNNKVINKDLLSSFEKGYSLADIGIQTGDQIMANRKTLITIRLILDYIRFGMSIVSIYLIIQQYK